MNTTAEGREAHYSGAHNVANATPEERAKWAEVCAYCARIALLEGAAPRRTYEGGPSYSVGPRTARGPRTGERLTTAKPVSEKQVGFLKKLLGEKDLTGTAYPSWDDAVIANLTSRDASAAIDQLLTLPRKPYRPVTDPYKEAADPEVTEDGMYQDPATETIFKVQIAKQGSGKLYAKKLVVEGEEGDYTASFEYAPGAIRKIRPEWKMTLEQAAKFGALYGVCCVCGRDLTDEGSIAAGIGPICAGRF
jgi:hypothetical protein